MQFKDSRHLGLIPITIVAQSRYFSSQAEFLLGPDEFK